MVSLTNIKKSFGSREVLGDISFTVRKGELLVLTGASGCGKTTILNIVSGLIRPDSGSVMNSGIRTGYAFQKDILIPWMSAAENLIFILKPRMHEKEARETADLWLEKVNLYGYRNANPQSMSGGMRKRLNIARAMSIDPDILLMDEPFAYLDKENITAVKKLVDERVNSRRSAVILVSHHQKSSGDTAGRIVKISGTPAVNIQK